MNVVGVRAVFFDAGNTLLEINYRVIAEGLRREGVEASPEALQRA